MTRSTGKKVKSDLRGQKAPLKKPAAKKAPRKPAKIGKRREPSPKDIEMLGNLLGELAKRIDGFNTKTPEEQAALRTDMAQVFINFR